MSEQTQNDQPEVVEELNASEADSSNDSSDQQEENASNESESAVDVVELKKQLEAAEQKSNEHRDAVLRSHAEMDNIRRRAERDVESAHKYALEGFVEALLPVIDSLEQGLMQETTSEESQALKQGMELTQKMLIDVLAKKNVIELNPIGENFNPQLHEAMAMQENPDLEPNEVMAVFQKGYTLNGRLVRPARVVVNKATAPKVDEQV